MRIGVIGINHKLASLTLREILARVCQQRFGPGNSIHSSHAFILLSTCNRTELYFSSEDLTETHSYVLNVLKQDIDEEFDQKLYSYFSQECFLHLVSVTAGLDSAIVGETEIQGQVKHAYETSLGVSIIPSSLHYLFQKSLKISKQIRAKYALKRGLPDLEHAIYHMGQRGFKGTQPPSILFVGASEINHKILEYFHRKGLQRMTVCNRTLSHAELLAKRFQIDLLPWSQLNSWLDFDWVILGTKAPHHLISRKEISSSFISHKLIMDLSFPRNVDPDIAGDSRIQLLNIDEINCMLKFRRKHLQNTLNSAEEEIQTMIGKHMHLFQVKQRHPAFKTYVA